MRTSMYVCIKTSIHRNIIVNMVLRRNKLIGIKLQQLENNNSVHITLFPTISRFAKGKDKFDTICQY